MKTALITGITGQDGSYLAEFLLKKGYEVAGTYHNKITTKFPEQVKLYPLDILDKDNLKKVFEEFEPRVIFHLAAISNVKFSMENPELTHKVNVEGTKNIIQVAENMDKSPAILIIGSANQYGIPEFLPITEEHPLDALNPYAESKIQCEILAQESVKKGFRIIIVRSFNHIGPRQTEDFVVSSFAKQIVEIEKGKNSVIKVGNLDAKRDFTDVRDIVKAYILAVEKADSGEPYNICSGNAYEIKEILDKLLELSKIKIKIEQDPSRMRKSDIPILLGTNKKFFAKTGWLPLIDIDTSLKDILEHWRKTIK